MLRFVLGIFGSIFTFLTLGTFFGVLTIGAVFFAYGRDLPRYDQLAQYTPPTISRIYSVEGQIIDEFARERRLFTPAEDIPDMVKHAFISAEDKNFYTHKGYDVRGMVSAFVDAVKGGRIRGASTIPQQVVKNFLLSSDRSAERKIKELILSVRLVNSISKDKILELYLNEIFLGQNSFGVTAAAQTYFNKSLSELLPQEAAYLASLPKSPSKRHPVRNQRTAIFWRNNTLREMFENGYIDEAAYRKARVAPLWTVQNGDYASFRSALPPRDYFTDEIRRQLSREFGDGEFFTGGLTVRASADPELQLAATYSLRRGLEGYDRDHGEWIGTGVTIPEEELATEEQWRAALSAANVARDVWLDGLWHPAVVLDVTRAAVTVGIQGTDGQGTDGQGTATIPASDLDWVDARLPDFLSRGDVIHVRPITRDSDGAFVRWSVRQVPGVQGAFMAMDVHSGRVLAMQGGFSYQHSVFNRATQATRQPGSSFKPFVYAAALDSGFSPATIIVDAPIEIDTPQGVWRPKNSSNRFYGPTPLRTGIEQSRNLMTVRLAEEVGMDTVAQYAERFGVYDDMGRFLANALGSEETSLFRMVAAYAMFANGGERVEPTLVDLVQDRNGQTVYRHDQRECEDCQMATLDPGVAPRIVSRRERVMDAITAYQLTSMMQGVVQRGTARRTVHLDVPVAGKTGTTNQARDVWFVGFTSNIVAGCYMGYDQPRPLGHGASGGGMCGPVFNLFMEQATAKYGGGPFEVPPGGQFIKINRYTGSRLPDDASGEEVVAEYFRLGEQPVFGIMFDGGFAVGSNLPMFLPGESEVADGVSVQTFGGNTVVVPRERADFGSLSAGGLY